MHSPRLFDRFFLGGFERHWPTGLFGDAPPDGSRPVCTEPADELSRPLRLVAERVVERRPGPADARHRGQAERHADSR